MKKENNNLNIHTIDHKTQKEEMEDEESEDQENQKKKTRTLRNKKKQVKTKKIQRKKTEKQSNIKTKKKTTKKIQRKKTETQSNIKTKKKIQTNVLSPLNNMEKRKAKMVKSTTKTNDTFVNENNTENNTENNKENNTLTTMMSPSKGLNNNTSSPQTKRPIKRKNWETVKKEISTPTKNNKNVNKKRKIEQIKDFEKDLEELRNSINNDSPVTVVESNNNNENTNDNNDTSNSKNSLNDTNTIDNYQGLQSNSITESKMLNKERETKLIPVISSIDLTYGMKNQSSPEFGDTKLKSPRTNQQSTPVKNSTTMTTRSSTRLRLPYIKNIKYHLEKKVKKRKK